jgi:hypothetical protein
MTMVRFTILLVVTILAVEVLLAFRAWVQLSGWQLDVGALRLLYDISTVLVAPFAGLQTQNEVSNVDVLEMSTMIASEAYLVLAIVAFAIGLFVRMCSKLVTIRFTTDAVVVRQRRQRQMV